MGLFLILPIWISLAEIRRIGALRLIDVIVPKYKLRGEMATLECLFDLENERLYSVKWYKDNEEFYRYVPRHRPNVIQSYKVEGIRVEHSMSNSNVVVLKSVNLRSSGVYNCEVSAEAPSFNSVNGQGEMIVVHLPKEGPDISGGNQTFQVGDVLDLNCTSGRSYPPTILQWFINDIQASMLETKDFEPEIHRSGLITTIIGLCLILQKRHFTLGNFQVRCVASIRSEVWNGQSTKVMQSDYPQVASSLIDNREALLLVTNSANFITSYFALAVFCYSLLNIISNNRFHICH